MRGSSYIPVSIFGFKIQVCISSVFSAEDIQLWWYSLLCLHGDDYHDWELDLSLDFILLLQKIWTTSDVAFKISSYIFD